MSIDISRYVQDAARLTRLRRLSLLDAHSEAEFDRLSRLATKALQVPAAYISFVDADRQFLKGCFGLPEPYASWREIPLTHSFCQYVVALREPLIIQDARKHPVAESPGGEELGIVAYLGIPLITSDGYALGSFCAIDSQPRAWTDGDLLVMQDLAATSMIEIERRAVEEALQAAREKLDQSIQANNQFLSRMSHELRTPLNAILGFAQLLELDSLSEAQRESVDQILRGGRHLHSLINEVVDITSIEAGNMPFSIAPIAVDAVLQDALSFVRGLAAQRAISLRVEQYTAGAQFAFADYRRLTQILLNLLTNAIKYNREGGEVVVACRAVGPKRLCISVRDTGPGIPPEQQARLFTPFERLGAERSDIEGTGLGLALSKALAEAMGGRMGVESIHGHGSTFWVELAGANAPVQVIEKSHTFVMPVRSVSSHTLLYVEDTPSSLALIKSMLAQQTGITLFVATEAALTLDLARTHRPDLIVLDLDLAGMRGDEVLKELHMNPETATIPVILISADTKPHEMQQLLALGVRGYLTKPLDVRRFLQMIDDILMNGQEVQIGA